MKRKTTKLVSLLLVIVTLLQCFVTVAFAIPTNDSATEIEDEVPTVYVEPKTAIAGSIIQIDVSLKGNKGLSSLKFNVLYDDALELVGVDLNNQIDATSTTPEPYSNPQCISMINPMKNITFNGVLATLTFKVNSDLANGYQAGIVIEIDDENVFDSDFNYVDVKSVSNNVTVYKSIPGDMDKDLKVTNKDAILLFRKISGWDIDLSDVETDLNGDGKSNNVDAILLFRSIASGSELPFNPVTACKHKLVYNEGKEPTCTEVGKASYWTCGICKESFKDSEAKETLEIKDLEISALGHDVVIDKSVAPTTEIEGKTEGKHCQVCGEILVPQAPIPMLKPTEHSITYRNTKNAIIPEEYHLYKEGKIFELPVIEAEGYLFKGWFSASSDGEIVDYIDQNSTNDIIVYARWEPVTYKIKYFEAPVNSNPTEYTIEDEIIFEAPQWLGLIFVGFEGDDRVKEVAINGKSYFKLEKGTTGNIELTAKWREYRNLVVPTSEKEIKFFFDENLGKYVIISEIGAIQNVIIGKLEDDFYKTTNIEKTFTASKTYTVETSALEEVSKTVSESVSKSNGWTEINAFVNSQEFASSSETALGLSSGEQSKVQAEVGGKLGSSELNRQEWQFHQELGETFEDEFGTSQGTSTSIAYTSQMTTVSENTYTISADMPNGYYLYAKTVDLRVFAVVVYDPATDSCKATTHCVLTNFSHTPLYFANKSDVYTSKPEALEYSVEKADVKAIIENSYYVEYDANGGEGSMKIEGFPVNKEQALAQNKFTKPGYSHKGWEAQINDETVFLVGGAIVTNLTSCGGKITLKAIWVPNNYTVNFDAAGGSVSVPSKNVTFGEKYAKLPTPTRTSYRFDGWFIGDTKITEETIVKIDSEHTLVAKWTILNYNVSYFANGGVGTMATTTFKFEEKKMLASNRFTRENHIHLGWSTSPTATSPTYKDSQEVVNLGSQNGEVIRLYAVWLKVSEKIEYLGRNIEIKKGQTHIDYSNPHFDIATLKANGYTHIKVSITFDAKRTKLIIYNYAHLTVHANGASAKLVEGHLFSDSWDCGNCVWWKIPIANCHSDGKVQLDWWAENNLLSSSGDGFYLGTTTVTFEAIKN